MAWRIATHETRPASIVEAWGMSTDDVIETHDVLDEIDDARARANRRAQEER